MKKYVTGFMFSANAEKVVLIRKLNPEWQKGLFNGVGGKVEVGETSLAAMVREFTEETGVNTKANDWTLFSNVYRKDYYDVDMFFARSDLAFTAKTVEAEPISLLPVNPLPENLIPNLRWLIPLALDQQADFSVPIQIKEIAVERTTA